MASTRENILTSNTARDKYLEGVVALDEERPGITAADFLQWLQANNIALSMAGINQDLSTYDLFVLWHIVTMRITLSTGNAAHGGPIFLPWHRMYLIRLEQEIQRVLGDASFGLPYWDWAADGELSAGDQWQADLWTSNYLGESRGDVMSGTLGNLRVRLNEDISTGILWSIAPRQILRQAGTDPDFPVLPRKSHVTASLGETEYDQPEWDRSSVGHRNHLEGWLTDEVPARPRLHNLVHTWIGGDMGPGTSPNDPVFFLNHCNVDRIWEAWMDDRGRVYRPAMNEGSPGHRIDDLMISILGDAQRPSDVLDPAPWYSYDSLAVS